MGLFKSKSVQVKLSIPLRMKHGVANKSAIAHKQLSIPLRMKLKFMVVGGIGTFVNFQFL